MPKSGKGLHCTIIDGAPHVNLFHSQEMFNIGPNYNKWVQSEWDSDLSSLTSFGLQAQDVFPADDPKCYMYYSLEGFLMLFFKKVCIHSLDAQRKMDYIKFLRHVCRVYAQQVTKVLSDSEGKKTAQVDLMEAASGDWGEGWSNHTSMKTPQLHEKSSPVSSILSPSIKERVSVPAVKKSKLSQKVDELLERRSRESSPNVADHGMNGMRAATGHQGSALEQRNGSHERSIRESPTGTGNSSLQSGVPCIASPPVVTPEPIKIKVEPPDDTMEENNHRTDQSNTKEISGDTLGTSPYSTMWMPKIGQTSSLAQGQGQPGQAQGLADQGDKLTTGDHPVAMHLRRKGYSCLTCKQTFANGKQHWMHKLETGHGQIFCEICHTRFLIEEDLVDHVCHGQDDSLQLHCLKCNKKFPNFQSKKAHQRYCGRSYRCNDCKQRFPDPDKLLSHRIVCTGPTASTDGDMAKMPTEKSRTRKVAAAAKRKLEEADIEEGRPLLNCVYCGAWLENAEYGKHVQRCKKQFRGRDKGFKCSDCELRFKTAEELVSHRVIHTNAK
ncbi:zinc finger and SCAN domain-containing protein 12 [Lingula anatina]|uniref:Zinc finger and SCAN domain-containing protein 12 n=1 Tax=Lingula anatina TaxID=7574 RepID=A0A1S3K6P1_LINAN|nr:zinc finger and SCAN domain-containing protein 12 [Lingula anatina]|eukprot:XP_013418305.1 zinc finger and SCAN domain-containing protein 12 [Lingula anatina]